MPNVWKSIMIKNLPSKYLEFIEECKMKNNTNSHTHNHHILPRFMGGGDDVSNLVELSVSDHFEAHKLLAETVSNKFKRGATASLNLLYKYWNGNYDDIRKMISEGCSGEKNGMYGKTHTDEVKQQFREFFLSDRNPMSNPHSRELVRLSKIGVVRPDMIGGNNKTSRKCIDLETNTEYGCIKEMAIAVGVPRTTMNRWIKDKRKTNYKYNN